MNLNTTLEQALALAKDHKVIPVIRTLFAGNETPLSIFEKLAAGKTGSFLLESAEQGVWARYSFVGVNNRGSILHDSRGTRWVSASNQSPLPDATQKLSSEPLGALAQLQAAWTSKPIPGVPPLVNGLVGAIGWDMIRQIENLPNPPKSDFEAPVLAMVMFRDLVIVDHYTSSVMLVSNIFVTDEVELNLAFEQATTRINQMQDQLLAPAAGQLSVFDSSVEIAPEYRVDKADFLNAVESAKHFVRIGDVFQIVLSQRFDVECTAAPLDVYRVLRSLNPSPYMYLLNFEDESGPYSVVGSSPEALVQVQNGKATTHPIAGSRPRGANLDADLELAKDLVGDAKERAEHLMLVDLARNDLLKVCKPDSVTVTEFMQVHRYSHIMHLVSTVEGQIRQDQSAVDVFKATFPAGTLSGAPKPRALEIIDELEVAGRGIYGGVVGYFDFAGNADLAIAIRTAFIRNGRASVQAGAGLVLDSVAEMEYQETVNKAGAPLRAIATANTLKLVRASGYETSR